MQTTIKIMMTHISNQILQVTGQGQVRVLFPFQNLTSPTDEVARLGPMLM